MNQEQKMQLTSLVSDLNTYLIKITNIVYKINSVFSKMTSFEEKSNFNFLEQMNNLIKEINNAKYNELPKIENNNISGMNLDSIKNINFKTTLGNKTILEMDKNNSIDELLKKYLDRINKSDIINNPEESLYFTYNAEKLEFGDQRKIEEVFATNNNPTVLVSEF
jgi:hypothetical protein